VGHPLLRSLVATLCRDDTAQSVIPSNYNAVIPSRYSAVIPSRDNAVIPTATALSSRQLQHCHPEPLQGCHPDRSGGISQPWQRLRLWALCSGDPSAALRMTGLCAIPSRYNAVIPTATTLPSRAATRLSSRPQWRDLTTLAETQTLGSLFGRSFGCAQDDRPVCYPESLQWCHPEPLQCCHPDSYNTVIPTATTLSSRPQWRDLTTLAETQTLGSLFGRSFGCAQDDRPGCHPESLQ